MKKTLLASAIALTIGVAGSVQAQTITINTMRFGGAFGASGTMNSNGDGRMQSTENFQSNPWVADQINWFDTHDSNITWSGTAADDGAIGDFSYNFTLTGNQVAAGTYFDWSTNLNIPVLTIYDCPVTGGGSCIGKSLGMAAGPFPDQRPRFDGTTADDFPVSGVIPVPAAVWLMGSGLLGLVGVARRRKVA